MTSTKCHHREFMNLFISPSDPHWGIISAPLYCILLILSEPGQHCMWGARKIAFRMFQFQTKVRNHWNTAINHSMYSSVIQVTCQTFWGSTLIASDNIQLTTLVCDIRNPTALLRTKVFWPETLTHQMNVYDLYLMLLLEGDSQLYLKNIYFSQILCFLLPLGGDSPLLKVTVKEYRWRLVISALFEMQLLNMHFIK